MKVELSWWHEYSRELWVITLSILEQVVSHNCKSLQYCVGDKEEGNANVLFLVIQVAVLHGKNYILLVPNDNPTSEAGFFLEIHEMI